MTKPGHIKITDKGVIFVYHELPKPFLFYTLLNGTPENCIKTKNEMRLKEYEASKREVEVNNVFFWNVSKVWMFTSQYYSEFDGEDVKHNQSCEAEVEDKIATITKII